MLFYFLSGLLAPHVFGKMFDYGGEYTQVLHSSLSEADKPYVTSVIWPAGVGMPYQWEKRERRFAAIFDSINFVPWDEFTQSKQTVTRGKDLLEGVISPELHALIDTNVVCHGRLDDYVECSQPIEHDKFKLEARIDRKNCWNCWFHAGDCSRCPILDGTTESCSSADSASDDSEKDCKKSKHR